MRRNGSDARRGPSGLAVHTGAQLRLIRGRLEELLRISAVLRDQLLELAIAVHLADLRVERSLELRRLLGQVEADLQLPVVDQVGLSGNLRVGRLLEICDLE